ncbi:hypothetical protein IH785_14470 [candidate division KSB1 bacterium]|nr:hypothetical protein [candidate division KSB1 bacterium]
MNQRTQFEETLRAKLIEWQTQVDEIKSNAHQVPPQYQLEFERQLDLLFAKSNLAQEKLAKMQNSGDLEWGELKVRLDGIWNEIENAIDSATAKID